MSYLPWGSEDSGVKWFIKFACFIGAAVAYVWFVSTQPAVPDRYKGGPLLTVGAFLFGLIVSQVAMFIYNAFDFLLTMIKGGSADRGQGRQH